MDKLIENTRQTIEKLEKRKAELRARIKEGAPDRGFLQKRAELLALEIEELEDAIRDMIHCKEDSQ